MFLSCSLIGWIGWFFFQNLTKICHCNIYFRFKTVENLFDRKIINFASSIDHEFNHLKNERVISSNKFERNLRFSQNFGLAYVKIDGTNFPIRRWSKPVHVRAYFFCSAIVFHLGSQPFRFTFVWNTAFQWLNTTLKRIEFIHIHSFVFSLLQCV